ncbi:hypothetical protein [Bradyrhizobium sp. UFLA05-112]
MATLKLFSKPRTIETGILGPEAALKLLSIERSEATGALTSFGLLSWVGFNFSIRNGGRRG